MSLQRYEIVVTREEDSGEYTLETLASRAGVHPSLVERFIQLDLLHPLPAGGDPYFDSSSLIRLRMICRLRQTLGINLAGISVVLDLLDKLSAARRENELLRARERGF